jgi:hypothetical protein
MMLGYKTGNLDLAEKFYADIITANAKLGQLINFGDEL